MSDLFPPAADGNAADGAAVKTVLNIGCGPRSVTLVQDYFPAPAWREVRLDIDPAVEPDIVASITDMAAAPDESVDAVWSSHNLEHLFPHDTLTALRECRRVLRPGGAAFFFVPDIQAVAEVIARGDVNQPLYMSDLGPIMPLDVIYGFAPALAEGRHYMAHRWGFTPDNLGRLMNEAGFDPAIIVRAPGYELQVRAYRPPVSPETMQALQAMFAPAPETPAPEAAAPEAVTAEASASDAKD